MRAVLSRLEEIPGDPDPLTLLFLDVVGFKGTALRTLEPPLIRATYDTLVEFVDTTLLRPAWVHHRPVRHLGILFDDEWFYEFLSSDYRITFPPE